MRKLFLLLNLAALLSVCVNAQDFTNKGRDFWVGYGYHQVMLNGNSQDMVLYFATEYVTKVTVTIPGIGYSQTYSAIPANTVFASNPIPKSFPDARLTSDGQFNLGIHITSDKPIVAYAHIYNQSVSGATVLYPTNTLGKEYYSVNYKNNSNTGQANCWFYVVATDTGTTTVEITPSAATINHAANVPFTINMQQGDIYNAMGTVNGNSGVDLTGSKIRSISNNNQDCKRIAVYSGSGRIAISCNGSAPSSDNYMVQGLPTTAWGKHFLTVPTAYYAAFGGNGLPLVNNIYRICVKNPSTAVLVNGAPIAVPLTNGFYYELAATAEPLRIEADDAIMVAQYLPSQSACGTPGGDGDPEVIYLSPVEQSINNVRWNACRPFAIQPSKNWINVIIPSGGTAISSFKLDGVPLPPGTFTTHPNDPNYSYAVINVAGTSDPGLPGVAHVVSSDSGFNAIAYGYGNAESYGYNAGTNVKDLYQFIQLANPYATVDFPAACQQTPFYFSIVFPYIPTQINWDFNGLFPNVTIGPTPAPVPDSTWTVNGRPVYRFKLPTPYTVFGVGTFPITVTAYNPTGDGCSNVQEINYDLQVFPPPAPDFTVSNSGCLSDSVHFFGTVTNSGGRPIAVNNWDFGDGGTSGLQNPAHLYAAAGTYLVNYSVITDVGCVSNPTNQFVTINNPPIANFTASTATGCQGSTLTFTDNSNVNGGPALTLWEWNFGDGSPVVNANSNAAQTHVYNTPGTYTVTLRVKATNCYSLPFTRQVTVVAKPLASFTFGGVCLPNGSTQFTSNSTATTGDPISTYTWNFGDGNPAFTGSPSAPVHVYTTTGPFNVTLTVTSTNGCVDDTLRIMDQVYAQPVSNFNVDAPEHCNGTPFAFTDNSAAPNSTIGTSYWDFGDASGVQNGTSINHTYALPGTYTVKHWVTSAQTCMSDTMQRTIIVNANPTASFTHSTTSCAGSPITFTSTSVPNSGTITTYSWTINGSPAGNTSSISYTPATSGNLTVVLNITTDKGCTAQNTQTVAVSSKPLASFTFGGACLPSGATTFTNNSTNTSSTFNSSWNFGDGSPILNNNSTTVVHPYATSGPFTVTLTVTSLDGCIDDTVRLMDQVYAQPTSNFTADAIQHCDGTGFTFTDNSTVPNSSTDIYYWDFGDGSPIQSGTGAGFAMRSYTYATPGTYTVKHWIKSLVGCFSDTMPKTVTVLQLPTASFTVSAQPCQLAPITFTSTSVPNAGSITGYNWTVNSTAVPGGNTMTYTPAASGNITVVLSVTTNNGCTGQVSQVVNVKSKPLASFNFGGACLPSGATTFTNNSTNASSPILNSSWNFGDGSPVGINNTSPFVHIYSSSGPFTVTLTVTSQDGCTDDSVRLMDQVYAQPTSSFTADALQHCDGTGFTFTDNSTVPNNSVDTSYWNYGDASPVFVSHNGTANHTYTTPGTYTVKHWIKSLVGCISDTMSKTITVLPLPTASFTVGAQTCQLSPITFTSTSVPNAGTITGYNWTVNSTAVPGGNTMTYTPSAAGNITVVLSVNTNNGCTAQSTQTVNVHAKPNAVFTMSNACLPTGAMTFTSTSNVSDGSTFTLGWDFGDGGTAPNINPATHNYTSTGPYNAQLTVTTQYGCTDVKTTAVTTIYAQPVAVITSNPEVCNGTSISFSGASSSAPGSSITTYSWDFGDGNTGTGQSPSHTYTTAGPKTVTLTVTSAVGCTSVAATTTVTVNPLPTANFNVVGASCVTKLTTFADASAANAGTLDTWTWAFGDGGTSNTQNPTHTYATTGNYNVTLQVHTTKGCTSTVVTKPVKIGANPVVDFLTPETCLNDPFAQFTDQSSISDGTQTLTYLWNFGDGGPTSNTVNAQHTYTAAGPYNVTLTVTSFPDGCATTATKPFFVNGPSPVPMFTVQGSSTFCSGGSIGLVDNSTVNPGNVVKLEIYWDYTSDPTIKTTDDDPAPGKIYNHTYPQFATPASRNVTIRYVAYSGQTCLQYIDRVITLQATPQLQFNPVSGICQDVPAFQITQASILNGLPGTGTFSGPGVSATGMFDPAAAGPGAHTIRYTYVSTNTCTNFVEQTVEVYPKPVANAGPDKFMIQGGVVTLTPAMNAGFPVTYTWTPPTYLDNPNIPNPKASPPADITYLLTVTSDKGCSDTNSVFVMVLKNPLVPNIFSPNGDGVHDTWVIPYLNTYPGCTVDIYNRYGQLVFHSVGYDTPWDGKVNGKSVPVGTYYYIINPKNGRGIMSGYVDVIR